MTSGSNLPLVEQWHEAAMAYVDAEAAAQILEESKRSVLSERITSLRKANPKLSRVSAEDEVRASPAWHDYIQGMVRARTNANRMRVERDTIDKRFWMQKSEEANHRMEARMS